MESEVGAALRLLLYDLQWIEGCWGSGGCTPPRGGGADFGVAAPVGGAPTGGGGDLEDFWRPNSHEAMNMSYPYSPGPGQGHERMDRCLI